MYKISLNEKGTALAKEFAKSDLVDIIRHARVELAKVGENTNSDDNFDEIIATHVAKDLFQYVLTPKATNDLAVINRIVQNPRVTEGTPTLSRGEIVGLLQDTELFLKGNFSYGNTHFGYFPHFERLRNTRARDAFGEAIIRQLGNPAVDVMVSGDQSGYDLAHAISRKIEISSSSMPPLRDTWMLDPSDAIADVSKRVDFGRQIYGKNVLLVDYSLLNKDLVKYTLDSVRRAKGSIKGYGLFATMTQEMADFLPKLRQEVDFPIITLAHLNIEIPEQKDESRASIHLEVSGLA